MKNTCHGANGNWIKYPEFKAALNNPKGDDFIRFNITLDSRNKYDVDYNSPYNHSPAVQWFRKGATLLHEIQHVNIFTEYIQSSSILYGGVSSDYNKFSKNTIYFTQMKQYFNMYKNLWLDDYRHVFNEQENSPNHNKGLTENDYIGYYGYDSSPSENK